MSLGTINIEDCDGKDCFAINARPDVMIRLKRIFPRAEHHRTGTVTMVATPEVARDLEWVLQRWPMDMAASVKERMAERATAHRDTEAAVREILAGGSPTLKMAEPSCEERDYQVTAADLTVSTGSLLLMDGLGLGKTVSALRVLGAPDALPALIVVPTHMPKHWMDRTAMVWPLMRTHVIRKGTPYDPARTRQMRGFDPDVLICGYSKLSGWGDHLTGKINTIIFDEVQALRRGDSQKYTAAAQIADGARYAMGLSATPIYNYGGEIFNIMSVLSPDALGDKLEFAREWCGGYWNDAKTSVSDPGALAEYLTDAGLILRRSRKDVGRELPEEIPITHVIDTDAERFDELTSTALDLAAQIVEGSGTKFEQFAAKGDFDLKVRKATGIAKAPHVADYVRMLLETDEPVVLFGWHHDVYDIWRECLADHKPVFYTGQESPSQKDASVEAFVSGETKLLIMSLRSGEGLDELHKASKVAVFGELDWSPGIHKQCVGRLVRDDMVATENDPPLAYYLVSELGTDPIMADILELKEQQAAPFENANAELFKPIKRDKDHIKALAESFLKRKGGKR